MQNLKLFIKAVRLRLRDIRNKQAPPSKWHKSMLLYPFRLFAHPIDTFNDLKYEKKASMWIANSMALIFFIVRLLEQTSMGYLYTNRGSENTSIFTVLFISLGVLIAFTLCNWATCTLGDGEGTMGDIWTVTTYSLLPYILLSILTIVLSHAFTNTEATFFTFFRFLGIAWTLILIFLGLLVVHQYTVVKTVLTLLATMLIILCMVFLALLFLSIFQQVYSFIVNVIREVIVRNL